MSNPKLRAGLQAALQQLAEGDLQRSALALLATLGYASGKTIDLPSEPKLFAQELEALVGGTKPLAKDKSCLTDWKSATFLFQLTNDELPTLAAGQMSLLSGTGDVQVRIS